MKLISTRITGITLFLLVFGFSGITQTKYVFTGASLVSGTALKPGAVYKFASVKSGVDAWVTIMDITGGITLTDIDGGGGFSQALQPVLSVPAYSNGYAEFTVTFYQAGTTTLMPQAEVPVTPIDVDGQKYGGLPLYEFDEIEEVNGYTYFQYAGSELTMSRSGVWARGKNNAAIDYPGIDTAQKQVMFTTVNANVSSMRIRVGADNQSASSASRLRSLYFQKFNYPYSYVLAKEAAISFAGSWKNNGIEIKGTVTGNQEYDKLQLERSRDGVRFEPISQSYLVRNPEEVNAFGFFDYETIAGNRYYRIRIINTATKKEQLSAVVMINDRSTETGGIRIVNSLVQQSNPMLTIQSDQDETIQFYVTDLNGQVVYTGQSGLYTGTNAVQLRNAGLQTGNFVIVVKSKRNVQSQKIAVR